MVDFWPSFSLFCDCRYGSLFRTSLVGRPVIVSSDPDFIYFLLQQEGKLVERWYMGSFAKLLLIKKLHQSFQNMAPYTNSSGT
jgi:hypothetical protein